MDEAVANRYAKQLAVELLKRGLKVVVRVPALMVSNPAVKPDNAVGRAAGLCR